MAIVALQALALGLLEVGRQAGAALQSCVGKLACGEIGSVEVAVFEAGFEEAGFSAISSCKIQPFKNPIR